jgi:hypothetical protein
LGNSDGSAHSDAGTALGLAAGPIPPGNGAVQRGDDSNDDEKSGGDGHSGKKGCRSGDTDEDGAGDDEREGSKGSYGKRSHRSSKANRISGGSGDGGSDDEETEGGKGSRGKRSHRSSKAGHSSGSDDERESGKGSRFQPGRKDGRRSSSGEEDGRVKRRSGGPPSSEDTGSQDTRPPGGKARRRAVDLDRRLSDDGELGYERGEFTPPKPPRFAVYGLAAVSGGGPDALGQVRSSVLRRHAGLPAVLPAAADPFSGVEFGFSAVPLPAAGKAISLFDADWSIPGFTGIGDWVPINWQEPLEMPEPVEDVATITRKTGGDEIPIVYVIRSLVAEELAMFYAGSPIGTIPLGAITAGRQMKSPIKARKVVPTHDYHILGLSGAIPMRQWEN